MRFSKQKFYKQAMFYHNLTNYTKKKKLLTTILSIFIKTNSRTFSTHCCLLKHA